MRPLTEEELAARAARKAAFDQAMAERKAMGQYALDEAVRLETASGSWSDPESLPDPARYGPDSRR
jgi:hypothetical protein